MVSLVFASNNQHKIREIREITGNVCNVLSLDEIGLQGDIPETADTIEGNARQKARYVFDLDSLIA